MDLENRVRELIANQAGVAVEKLRDDITLYPDLGFDSLDQVELVIELEEEFDINIPDDVAEQTMTVGQAIAAVRRIVTEP